MENAHIGKARGHAIFHPYDREPVGPPLPIDLAAMADADDENEENVIFDVVDNAVIALADTIRALRRIGQHFDTMRARVVRQRFSACDDLRSNRPRELAQLSISSWRKSYLV